MIVPQLRFSIFLPQVIHRPEPCTATEIAAPPFGARALLAQNCPQCGIITASWGWAPKSWKPTSRRFSTILAVCGLDRDTAVSARTKSGHCPGFHQAGIGDNMGTQMELSRVWNSAGNAVGSVLAD